MEAEPLGENIFFCWGVFLIRFALRFRIALHSVFSSSVMIFLLIAFIVDFNVVSGHLSLAISEKEPEYSRIAGWALSEKYSFSKLFSVVIFWVDGE